MTIRPVFKLTLGFIVTLAVVVWLTYSLVTITDTIKGVSGRGVITSSERTSGSKSSCRTAVSITEPDNTYPGFSTEGTGAGSNCFSMGESVAIVVNGDSGYIGTKTWGYIRGFGVLIGVPLATGLAIMYNKRRSNKE